MKSVDPKSDNNNLDNINRDITIIIIGLIFMFFASVVILLIETSSIQTQNIRIEQKIDLLLEHNGITKN